MNALVLGQSSPVSFSHRLGGQAPNLEPFTPGFQGAMPAGGAPPALGKPASLPANGGGEGLLLARRFSLPLTPFMKKRYKDFSPGHRACERKEEAAGRADPQQALYPETGQVF